MITATVKRIPCVGAVLVSTKTAPPSAVSLSQLVLFIEFKLNHEKLNHSKWSSIKKDIFSLSISAFSLSLWIFLGGDISLLPSRFMELDVAPKQPNEIKCRRKNLLNRDVSWSGYFKTIHGALCICGRQEACFCSSRRDARARVCTCAAEKQHSQNGFQVNDGDILEPINKSDLEQYSFFSAATASL